MLRQEAADRLRALIAEELRQPLWGAVEAMAEAIRRRHGEAAATILFYGSCLRDRCDADRVMDFYVFPERYRDFHGRLLPAALNALLPPNVYYIEAPFEGRTIRAKYAVVSLPALTRQTARHAFLPPLWARLAQPCALVHARDAAVAARVADALASAALTLLAECLPLMPPRFAPRQLWTRAFAETFRTELRAERSNRPQLLYEAAAARYDRITRLALAEGALPGCTVAGGELVCVQSPARRSRARLRWAARRGAGRALHVLRLAKAAFTFSDGLDYILWKIGRHSGVMVEPTPWQRRHPLMAAPVLAWRLFRRGAFR